MQRLWDSEPHGLLTHIRHADYPVAHHRANTLIDYLESDTSSGELEERLTKLSNFQLLMIKHAMKCKYGRLSDPSHFLITDATIPSPCRGENRVLYL